MKYYLLLLFIWFSLSLNSCTPEPDIDLPDYSSKLVIDGYIEQNRYPKVILTRSSSYFDNVDSASIRRFIVSTAKVTVSDGESEEILTYRKGEEYFPPYVYEGTLIKGEAGKTYSLKVELEGEVYTASTTIPVPPTFDSLWFERSGEDTNTGLLYGKFIDPGQQVNFYRIFTKREGKDERFIPVYYSAVSDIPFNGQAFTFSMIRGSASLTDVKDDTYFEKGDTVTVKFCSIDEPHFRFWSGLENELYMAGNPFASSGNKVKSNVSDNALGVWGGYGATYYSLIIK